MLNKITAIIVDDEKPAREEMQEALKQFEKIEIIAICSNATQAIIDINNLKPDAVFLDIEMPGINGFDLVNKLNYTPEIIFCTAYNQFAIQAFEENALDYLLKPIQVDRLQKTIEKLEQKIKINTSNTLANKRITLQNGNAYFITNLAEIYLIEADGNYLKYYFNNKKVLKLGTLKKIESELPEEHFIKINRSQIINKNFIKTILNNVRNINILLNNDMSFQVSRSFTSLLKNISETQNSTKIVRKKLTE